jgi:hypothetical protein
MTTATAGRVRSLPFLRALGTRDFRLLWTSEVISLVGDQFHFISWIQRRVDHAMIGRVMSLVMLMGVGITPLSLAISGLLFDLNATLLFVGAGVLVLGTAIVVAASGWVALFDAPPPDQPTATTA